MAVNRSKKVYLAGPDVFRLDWQDWACQVDAHCHKLGLTGVFPLPTHENLNRPNVPGISVAGTKAECLEVAETCEGYLHSVDIIVANLTPFRGDEPDSGTVFEVATGHFLNKPVIGYTHDPRKTHERHPNGHRVESGALVCADGYLVEWFNEPCNAMVVKACKEIILGSVFNALELAAKL